jgi:glutamate dehydrogenase (NAD(P)+)
MAWIMDTYSNFAGYAVPGVVTGKPVNVGGSLGRHEATGRGVAFTVKRALEKLHIPFTSDGPTAAVQGFGNVGSVSAKYLHQQGIRVVAVTDVHGGIYNPKGLDVPALLLYARERGTVVGFDGAEKIDNKQLLALPVDILVPAALANTITGENADTLKCKILAEGANGPVSPEADKILLEKGVFIIPGILANSGGVVVSYFEWVQDIQRLFWDEGQVCEKLYYLMGKAFDEVYELSKAKNVDTRMAAMMIGVGRVAAAKTLRGLYP